MIDGFNDGNRVFDSSMDAHSVSSMSCTTDHYVLYYNNDRDSEVPVWIRWDNGKALEDTL